MDIIDQVIVIGYNDISPPIESTPNIVQENLVLHIFFSDSTDSGNFS
jgi:hypothetical protein